MDCAGEVPKYNIISPTIKYMFFYNSSAHKIPVWFIPPWDKAEKYGECVICVRVPVTAGIFSMD
jgi:hypothetical protein